jgi:electron transport complex protein RnfA
MPEVLHLALAASLVTSVTIAGRLPIAPSPPRPLRLEAALGFGIATLLVTPIAVALAWAASALFAASDAVRGLDTLVLLLACAAAAPAVWSMLLRLRPALGERVRGGVPLLAANAAALGSGLVGHPSQTSGPESVIQAFASGAAFALLVVLLALLEERIETSDVPQSLRGAPIALLAAGVVALAIAGLNGMGTR